METRLGLVARRCGLAVVLVASIGTSLPALAVSGDGRIAFTSDRDGNDEIYVMNPDGSGQTRLTNNSASDTGPSWSPDGTRIAFASDRDGNYEIYVMNADGSSPTRLTSNAAHDSSPTWSPDGSKIAFHSDRDTTLEIYVMNANGSNQTRIVNNSMTTNTNPDWSPDGSEIAFDGEFGSEGNQIMVMNVDGTNLVGLTANFDDREVAPDWSPDGTQIAFDFDHGAIIVMDADGTGRVPIASSGFDGSASWSPDGTSIAFDSLRDGNSEIYVMNSDGTGQTNLTKHPGHDVSPNWWGPPGQRFVDVPTSHVFHTAIGWLAAEKITVGCNPPANDRFCPDDAVSRGQMAAFLVRALDLDSYTGPDRFSDDDGNVFEAAIERLAQAGITVGCNPPANDRFCPDDPVNRGQMAAFLRRALK